MDQLGLMDAFHGLASANYQVMLKNMTGAGGEASSGAANRETSGETQGSPQPPHQGMGSAMDMPLLAEMSVSLMIYTTAPPPAPPKW